MVDPRWLDPNIEPSDREPGACYLGDQKTVNDGPIGLAKFCTLRSWLSQWSIDDAQCDAINSGAKISIPALSSATRLMMPVLPVTQPAL